MRLLHSLLASAALMGLTLAAHATTDTTFTLINGNVSNPYNPTQSGTITGTLSINTTTYIVDAANLTFNNSNGTTVVYSSPRNAYYSSLSGYFDVEIDKVAGVGSNDIELYVKTPGDALGNLTLCLQSTEKCGLFNDSYLFPQGQDLYFTSGTLSPQSVGVAATPEPSSLILLGTGVLGVAGAARRRFLNAN